MNAVRHAATRTARANTDVFSAVADPTRREILHLLSQRECSVNELCERFDVSQPAISPDGKFIACRYREQDLSPFELGIISFETGEKVKAIDLPSISAAPTGTLQWSADGRAVLYIDTKGGVSDIWSQPLDGPAKQLTNFRTDQIFSFDWSRDGKQLLMARGNVTNDVVLIVETR